MVRTKLGMDLTLDPKPVQNQNLIQGNISIETILKVDIEHNEHPIRFDR
jgi:hypothetical protein